MEPKTVFIVDDDVTNLTIGADTLSESYHVFTFNSGDLVMQMLERHIPDLILLDVEMPEMNGYGIIQQLKENAKTRHIPVIFLTAKSDVESELRGLSMGAIDYIIKPFSPPLLLKRIEVHLLVESQKQELQDFNNNLLDMVEAKTKTVLELQNAILKTMAELVDRRDGTTGGHIGRTQCYMRVLLNTMLEQGFYREEASTWNLNLVVQSTLLHDVGKVAIKDSILQKPGKLTEAEFEEIKKHTTFGEEVILKIQRDAAEYTFLEYAKIFAGSHHEKWDGSGYPRGLKGEEIPLLGRVMAIVDVYDAIVSERPYKKALPHSEAVAIILENRGKHFDPVFVDLFLSVSDKFNEIAVTNPRGDSVY
ncbi:MAG: response regulator [Planctomycetaceae bacterium]|nr:response regulator [Planctomycetaceae bacterium]